MQQPQRFGMMTSSFGPMIPGCPRGLETLAQADSIIVTRKWAGCKSKYEVKTVTGEMILLGPLKTANCSDICCTSQAIHHIHLSEPNQDREVLNISWLIKCCSLSQRLEVSTDGTPMGSVAIENSWCSSAGSYNLLGPGGDQRFQIKSQGGVCCSTNEYPVMAAGGGQVGSINYKSSGACCTADMAFEVVFPPGLDVASKATLMTVVPLIAAEIDQKNNRRASAIALIPTLVINVGRLFLF